MEHIKKMKRRKETYWMIVDLTQAWGPFLDSSGNVSGRESCFMFFVLVFNIKVSIILKMIQKKSYRAFRETVITCYLASASVIVNGVLSLFFFSWLYTSLMPFLVCWFVCFFCRATPSIFGFIFKTPAFLLGIYLNWLSGDMITCLLISG